MKNQYFGDVNDYRKYGLLRQLANHHKLGVCWMLTADDTRPDGEQRAYLRNEKGHRHLDPELFDLLKQSRRRHVRRLEESGLLAATYHTDQLKDGLDHRLRYFEKAHERLSDCDLWFFDPDNGLEVRSVTKGKRGASRYLFYDELAATFDAGKSLVVYQHNRRQTREFLKGQLSADIRSHVRVAPLFIQSPHVLFVVVTRRMREFEQQLSAIAKSWFPHWRMG